MATKVILNWASNPASELVTSYKVWQSKDNGSFINIATVDVPSMEILNPIPGLYKWAISAANFVGESIKGVAAVGPNIPSVPPEPTITIVVV